jgi:hypothetical protein
MTMSEIWKFISQNALVSTIAGAAVLGIVGWLWKIYRDRRDSRTIYDFLLMSASKTDWGFRTTHAISSATKISEERVAELCSKHSRIRRNEQELQSWRLDA